MKLGALTIGEIDEWAPGQGTVTSWHASAKSREKALEAPVSDVPVSFMQAQHLRGFHEQRRKGLDYSRLMIVGGSMAGRCDIRAMTYIINSHLRRHDTYRSWFEYTGADKIVRHTMPNPKDIEFVPTKHGEMTSTELRELILATPDPGQWDCFTYGVMQAEDHFSFYVSVDHLHVDAMLVGVILTEFHVMYTALTQGSAPISLPRAGSYDDFCRRQREKAAELSLETPLVRVWTEFAEKNNGGLPDFPLPLGDPTVPCSGDLYSAMLMDEDQTGQFESTCLTADARFIGGVMACFALVEHELTGVETYYGLTPYDTRSTSEEIMTLGWFTGMVPVTVPASTSFAEAARAAQASFDAGVDVAYVPFYRVLELAPWLSWPRPNFPVVNFFDSGVAPLSAFVTADLDGLDIGLYSDGRYPYQMSIFVIRLPKETVVTVMYPDNPIARESVLRYVEALKSTFVRVAERRDTVSM